MADDEVAGLSQVAKEFYAMLNSLMGPFFRKSCEPQHVPAIKGLYSTLGKVLGRRPQQLQEEVHKELRVLQQLDLFSRQPVEVQANTILEIVSRLCRVNISFAMKQKNNDEEEEFCIELLFSSSDVRRAIFLAYFQENDKVYYSPLLSDKGKEVKDYSEEDETDEATGSPGGEEEEEAGEKGVSDDPMRVEGLPETPDLNPSAVVAKRATPWDWEFDERVKNRIRLLADRIREEHHRELSFTEYQECISMVGEQNMSIQNKFTQFLEGLGYVETPQSLLELLWWC